MNVFEGGSKRLYMPICTFASFCFLRHKSPALCFVLSEQTERYGVTFAPGAKTVAKLPVIHSVAVHEGKPLGGCNPISSPQLLLCTFHLKRKPVAQGNERFPGTAPVQTNLALFFGVNATNVSIYMYS